MTNPRNLPTAPAPLPTVLGLIRWRRVPFLPAPAELRPRCPWERSAALYGSPDEWPAPEPHRGPGEP